MSTYRILHLANKYNYSTKVNGSHEDVARYFVGNTFNRGHLDFDVEQGQTIERENMQEVINIAQVVSSADFNSDPDLCIVTITNPFNNQSDFATYSPKFKGVLGFIDSSRPYYNSYTLDNTKEPIAPNVNVLIFPTVKSSGKSHRLLVENGRILTGPTIEVIELD